MEVKFLMATLFHEMKIPSLLFSLLIEHPSYVTTYKLWNRKMRHATIWRRL